MTTYRLRDGKRGIGIGSRTQLRQDDRLALAQLVLWRAGADASEEQAEAAAWAFISEWKSARSSLRSVQRNKSRAIARDLKGVKKDSTVRGKRDPNQKLAMGGKPKPNRTREFKARLKEATENWDRFDDAQATDYEDLPGAIIEVVESIAYRAHPELAIVAVERKQKSRGARTMSQLPTIESMQSPEPPKLFQMGRPKTANALLDQLRSTRRRRGVEEDFEEESPAAEGRTADGGTEDSEHTGNLEDAAAGATEGQGDANQGDGKDAGEAKTEK